MPSPSLIRAVPRTRGPAHLPRSFPAGLRTRQLSRPFQSTVEAGVNGATVTTANSGGQVAGGYDDPFNVFSNNLPTFDNAHAHHGGLALKFTQPSGSANANSAGWTRLANPPGMPSFGRVYLFLTANPSQTVQLIRFSDATGTLIGGVRLTTTGTLVCLKANNAIVGSSSAALPLNAWIRVEARCLPSTVSGVGEIECRIWSTNPESAGAADTTLNNTGVASLGGNTIDRFEWGIAANPAAFTVTWNLWVDDIVGNATTWPGPAIISGAIINIGVTDNAFTGGLFPSLTLQPSTSLQPSSAAGGMSDSVGAVKVTGGSFSRSVSDTAATITDTVATQRTHVVADTGVAVTDSVATQRVRTVSDTGATVSDAVATNRARPISDTGATVTDSAATARLHRVADTGATISDSIRPTVTRPVSDTGASVIDSVVGGRGFARAVSDTATTATDSLATIRVRLLTDAGATFTDSVATIRLRSLSDTGASFSDAVVGGRGFARNITDTGLSITDTATTTRIRVVTSVGVTQSDSVTMAKQLVRGPVDVGVTQTDLVAALRSYLRSIVSTGVTQTDSLVGIKGIPFAITGAFQDGPALGVSSNPTMVVSV